MNHKYAQKKPQSRQRRHGWWFFIFSFSAAFLYIYYFHAYYHHTAIAPNVTLTKSSSTAHPDTLKKSSQEFDFYSMLPKIEVQIKNTETPNAPQLSSGQTYYLLQIATTPKNTEAEDLVTKLGVMGLNAYIKPYQKANNITQYRILVGPYTNRQDVDTDRAYLKTNHINSLFLSAKAP